jgi:hypothetical protein
MRIADPRGSGSTTLVVNTPEVLTRMQERGKS